MAPGVWPLTVRAGQLSLALRDFSSSSLLALFSFSLYFLLFVLSRSFAHPFLFGYRGDFAIVASSIITIIKCLSTVSCLVARTCFCASCLVAC
jgi:uncharacterized membrane protein